MLGWAVLPAFALVLAPEVATQALVLSLLIAVVMQMIVTRLVMGRAVKIRVAAVLAVVMLGTAIAGVMGAIFAIPTTGAILAITDYLKQARRPVARRRDRRPARRTGDRVDHDGLTMQRNPMWPVLVSTVSRLAGGRAIAQAVVRRTQVGAALHHPPRDVRAGRADAVTTPRGTTSAGCAARSTACATGLGCFGVKKSAVHSQTLPAMSNRP